MRLYRWLLYLYPTSYRHEYGDALIRLFGERYPSRPGVIHGVSVLLAALADVVPNALAVQARMLKQDLGQSVRSARRAPLFVFGAVFILALGIGADGAVFSILRATLLQPLPYRDPERVVMVWRTREKQPPGPVLMETRRHILTRPMVEGWRRDAEGTLSDLAAIESWQGNLTAQFDLVLDDRAERLRGAWVTPNFFTLLGVRPQHGRLFTDADETAGEPLIVLSHGLWQRAFGSDPSIIGRRLMLVVGRAPRAPRTFTVVGVLPPAFRFTYPQETEAWALLPWSTLATYEERRLAFRAIGRLAPGLTFEAAADRMRALRTALDRPGDTPETRDMIRLEPVTEWVVGETRSSMLLLGAVALLLLLITCATVANAVMVRVTDRQRELAVRASLGADPRRLVRQLLTEGVALSGAGAAAGAILAAMVAPLLRSLVPASVPRVDDIAVSGWIILFAAAAAALTTILAALAPAWRGARVDVMDALRRGTTAASADRGTTRWRQGLVGFQAGVAAALLITATLLLTSLWRLGQVPLGFDGERVLTVEMRLLDARYRRADVRRAFQSDLLTRIRAIPGVIEAGLTSAVPFRGVDFTYVLNRVGAESTYAANARFVDPAYFSVMRFALVRGRLFTTADGPDAPKAMIISESYARRMFGGEDPIGKLIDNDGPVEVVGVVKDARYEGLDREPRPAVYFPAAQWPSELICVVARTLPEAADVAPSIRRAIREIDRAVPAMDLTTVDRIIAQSVAGRRFYTTATSAFAVIALLLTVTGLIVIVSRSVVERRRELAIRGALGASTSRLVKLVSRQGLMPVAIGTGVGLAVAYWGANLLEQFVFQVAPRDARLYGAVALAIVLIALLSSLVPAFGVTRTAPATVLRAD